MSMSIWHTPEREQLRKTVRAFAEREVLPHVDEWEQSGMLPRELHRKAGDAGLLGAGLPEAVGGGGGDGADALIICEEMHYAGAPGGVFASLFTCGIAVPHMIASGDQRLIDTYVRPTLRGEKIGSLAITEPGGGSDVGHLTTKATRDGDDYIINGAKTYITSGVRADYVVTAARTGGPGAAGVSLIVVDKGTPGFEVTRKLDKMGWRSSDTAELSYTDVRVPAANLIGDENTGFVQIAAAFVSERVGLAAQAYASAQRCLDLTVEWCRNRETFGKPLISRQSVQNTLSEMARRVDVARVYTRSIVERQLASGAASAATSAETNLDHRGVLRQEHRRRGRRMGRQPGRPTVRRNGVHDRIRSRTPIPRHADPRDRRRDNRNPHRAGRQDAGIPVMTTLASTLDPRSPAYAEAAEAMAAKLAELDAEHAKALGGGGEKYVTRHHDRGKMTARERIEALLDPDSPFLELSPLAAYGTAFTVGASVVAGIGAVSGVECLVVSNDPTVKGGTSNPWTLKKILRANQIAFENRLPVISLVESGGADLPTQKEIFIPGGRMFRDLTRLSAAGIPTIALVFGNSTAGGAYIPGMSDHVVMIKERSKVFLAGPPLVKMATGEESDDESLGGAEMHARTSGLADYFAVDELDAIRIGRRIVARLNWRKQGPTPGPVTEPLFDAEELLGIVPSDLRIPFDPRDVIARVVDGSEFDEFKALYGSSLVTGWATLYGYPIGILANHRGVLFSEESQKATQFIQLANRSDTPLLFLHNTTGYMVGKKYEEGGMIKHGSMMINAVSNSTVPHLSLLIGASYGAGHYGMCGRAYDPRFLFAWPSAKSAVMGGAQLAGVLSIVSRAAAEARGQQVDEDADAAMRAAVEGQIEAESLPMVLSGMLYDDGVIDPRDTRTVLGMCLSAIANGPIKGTSNFGVFRM